jgi:undecaprenyl-diphosphatase
MDIVLLLKAFVLGIVEGLTEFLPVSSTGHLIIAGSLLNFNDERGKVFEVAIQFAAILAVCWHFQERILTTVRGLYSRDAIAIRLTRNLILAFIPAAVLGLLLASRIKAHLFAPVPVALAFIAGAFVIFWAERRTTVPRVQSVDELTALDAIKIGLCQSLALVPGTSRSGATIIGAMLFGVSRQAATEFSFFLAIPTLCAATLHEVIKYHALFRAEDIATLAVGSISSFIFAFITVKALLRYVSRNTFIPFAWYRILFGVFILYSAWSGLVPWGAD